MHSLWDAALENGSLVRDTPLSHEMIQRINDDSDSLILEFPKESLTELEQHPNVIDWIEESWNICKNNVYKDMFMDKTLDKNDDYIKKNIPIVRKQLALAGYRLSKMMTNIYKEYKNLFVPHEDLISNLKSS